MESNDNTLTCTAILDYSNAQGTTHRKLPYKNATLRLVRNESRQMFMEVMSEKMISSKLKLISMNVHKKFMSEGKATIVFNDAKCTVYISNAPPGNLFAFLRTIFVKMTGEKSESKTTSLRTQVLSHQKKSFEEISPVTIADLHKARDVISKTTDTTPSPNSRKRKLSGSDSNKHVSKKLYTDKPITIETLNIEQQKILDACLSGYNVFFTGSAGTGKSFLLKKIISVLPPDVTIVTASTGVAACLIGGATLHSFAGIGNGEGTLEKCYKIASKSPAAQIWRKCKHLIIDEVSMVDGKFFEKIEAVARFVRKNDRPFGGIQLILCGDFLQLPPVVRENKNSTEKSMRFCFQSPAWNRCINVNFQLKQVHRQTDLDFVNILNSIRVGRVTDEIVARLMKTSKQTIEQDGILATRLCSHTAEADTINQTKLKNLTGDEKLFTSKDSNEVFTAQLDQQTPVPSKLSLKVGAQVMLLKNVNISGGLVNGARGVVIGFRNDLPVVKFRNKEYVAKREKWIIRMPSGLLIHRIQVPLKLAWAFSIHKSQGLTLDCVEMSLGRVFEAGQAYVALSRAQSLDTLRVLDFSTKQVWANPDVIDFYRRLRRKIQEAELFPLDKKNAKSKPVFKANSLANIEL